MSPGIDCRLPEAKTIRRSCARDSATFSRSGLGSLNPDWALFRSQAISRLASPAHPFFVPHHIPQPNPTCRERLRRKWHFPKPSVAIVT